MPRFYSVPSSNIRAVGYDGASATLYVQFSSAAMYSYEGVPYETVAQLLFAPSPGSFFARNIKPIAAVKLTPEETAELLDQSNGAQSDS